MADLIYFASTSLDGYIDDADGGFEWAEPDAEIHEFVNELQRSVGTHLLGRGSYEVMAIWEVLGTDHPDGALEDDDPAMVSAMADYADLWRATDKVVFSTTLEATTTARTRLERTFDPVEVRRLVDEAERDVYVGGAGLAGTAISADLVDEYQLVLNPAVVGGGTPAWPSGRARVDLELVEQRRFGTGATFQRYRTRR